MKGRIRPNRTSVRPGIRSTTSTGWSPARRCCRGHRSSRRRRSFRLRRALLQPARELWLHGVMTAPSLPSAANADHLTTVLRKSGVLGDGCVQMVDLKDGRDTILTHIVRFKLDHDGTAD